jgi:hypothetical protein
MKAQQTQFFVNKKVKQLAAWVPFITTGQVSIQSAVVLKSQYVERLCQIISHWFSLFLLLFTCIPLTIQTDSHTDSSVWEILENLPAMAQRQIQVKIYTQSNYFQS